LLTRLGILTLCASLALGCASLVPGRSGRLAKDLQDTAERYADNLRWGRIEVAVKHVRPELREPFLALFGDERGALRLTEIEVASVEPGPEPEEAQVRVRVRLYRANALTEESLIEVQRWRFDRDRSAWLVEPDFALYESRRGL
jgi:hypothetical protein